MQYTYVSKVLILAISIFMTKFSVVLAAPGAHGPDGEHLSEEVSNAAQLNPKFEAFTETFELVGELFETELVIYLHNYASNTPVPNASIEVEVNGISTIANYAKAQRHYVVNDADILGAVSKPGEHEVILTILTEDAADLMSSTLIISAQQSEQEHASTHDDHHHHHFPWWAVGIVVAVFLFGLYVGRLSVRSKK